MFERQLQLAYCLTSLTDEIFIHHAVGSSFPILLYLRNRKLSYEYELIFDKELINNSLYKKL